MRILLFCTGAVIPLCCASALPDPVSDFCDVLCSTDSDCHTSRCEHSICEGYFWYGTNECKTHRFEGPLPDAGYLSPVTCEEAKELVFALHTPTPPETTSTERLFQSNDWIVIRGGKKSATGKASAQNTVLYKSVEKFNKEPVWKWKESFFVDIDEHDEHEDELFTATTSSFVATTTHWITQ